MMQRTNGRDCPRDVRQAARPRLVAEHNLRSLPETAWPDLATLAWAPSISRTRSAAGLAATDSRQPSDSRNGRGTSRLRSAVAARRVLSSAATMATGPFEVMRGNRPNLRPNEQAI